MKRFLSLLFLVFVTLVTISINWSEKGEEKDNPGEVKKEVKTVSEMVFGDWPEDESKGTVDRPRKKFKLNEKITFDFDHSDFLRTHVVIIKIYDESDRLVREQELEVDALFRGLMYEFYDPFRHRYLSPGKYKVQVFREKELLSEGTFEVIQ